MVSVVHTCSDREYLCFFHFLLMYTENSVSTISRLISQNCQWQKKSMSYRSYFLHNSCVGFDGSQGFLNVELCTGISLKKLNGGNGCPSIHKFPGNLPPSSPPLICPTPQPHQRYTEAGQRHCFSGLGSPCPRHFIVLALRTNPVSTWRYQ